MKPVYIMLLLLSLSVESHSFLGFGNKKVLPQHVCGSIEDQQIKSACMASYFNTDNKTSEKQKLLPLCLTLSETIDDLAKSLKKSQWNYIVDCLDQIGKIKESDFPEKQIEFCNNLISKSRSGEYSLPCLEKFNPNILEICELPLKKGSYGFTAECLKATQGYDLETAQVADLKKCTEPDKNQYLAVSSWATFSGCVQNKLQNIPGNPVRSRYNDKAPVSIIGNGQK